MRLGVLIAAAGCAWACERDVRWQAIAQLPPTLSVGSVSAVSSSSVFIGGCLEDRKHGCNEAAIYQWDGVRLSRVYGGRGDVVSTDRAQDGVTRAIDSIRTPRPYAVLLTSRGGMFVETSALPPGVWTQVVTTPAGELWALGSGLLAASSDDGKTWRAVEAPGLGDGQAGAAQGRLTAVHGRTAHRVGRRCPTIGPRMFLLGREKLAEVDPGGVRVTTGAGGVVAGIRGDHIVVGSPEHGSVHWFSELPRRNRSQPIRIRAAGKMIGVVTSREMAPFDNAVRVYVSRDGGRTWKASRLPDVHLERNVDLAPDGSLFAVDGARRLLLTRP